MILALIFALVFAGNPSPIIGAGFVSDQPNTLKSFESMFGRIISVSLSLAGIGLFVMLVMGGLKYLSSGGDPKALQSAKGTLTYAIIGVALLVLAWFALLFIKEFTGVDVTIFQIPG